jgi:peptidoglycan/LPS O-acetylase OafA/YrhL
VSTPERDHALDGLRAVAALIVVAFHTWAPGFRGGFIGVDIFFVLSGFVITRKLCTYLDAGQPIPFGRFLWERLARLYPTLLLVLVTFALLAPWLFPQANLAGEFWLSVFYLADYSKLFWDLPDYTSHTWSVAVEMQFYLFWPFAVVALHKAHTRAFWILLALFAVASLWRSVLFLNTEGFIRAYYTLDARLSGLILGSALAFMPWRLPRSLAPFVAIIVLFVLAFCMVLLRFGQEAASTWGGVLVDIASFALIASLLVPASPIARAFAWRPLVILGAWSYAIYLWHYPIARVTRDAFDAPVAFAITLIVSIALAGLTHELLEKRATRWLRSLRRPVLRPAE